MNHISQSSIEKAIEKVDNLDDSGLDKIAETYDFNLKYGSYKNDIR